MLLLLGVSALQDLGRLMESLEVEMRIVYGYDWLKISKWYVGSVIEMGY
jgi:hypothetical protein